MLGLPSSSLISKSTSFLLQIYFYLWFPTHSLSWPAFPPPNGLGTMASKVTNVKSWSKQRKRNQWKLDLRKRYSPAKCYCVSIWLHQVVLWVWEGLCPSTGFYTVIFIIKTTISFIFRRRWTVEWMNDCLSQRSQMQHFLPCRQTHIFKSHWWLSL